MDGQWSQFLAGGLTAGSVYALVALGYSIIFNASRVINFAQGEFVMIGGMSAVSLVATGVPMPMAIVGAIVIASGVGLLLEKLAVERARRADVVTLIIITIGASIFLRGLLNFETIGYAFAGKGTLTENGKVKGARDSYFGASVVPVFWSTAKMGPTKSPAATVRTNR